jgi:tetratricopeptide (TPR) repeat protein
MNRKFTHKSNSPQKKSGIFPLSPLLQGIIVVVLTLAVCIPSLHNGFVNWDDNLYIYENLSLLQGNAVTYILEPIQGNYHPVTQATLWLDYKLFGLEARGYHGSSLLWHALAALLSWLLAWRLSGNVVLSMFVGLGFGIHPLHVESFAWTSGRKDLVYAVFSLACLLSWRGWLSTRSIGLLGWGIGFFFLALFSKPMAVVLPLLMLLVSGFQAGVLSFNWTSIITGRRWVVPILLLLPAIGVAWATFVAQGNYGAIRQVEGLNIWDNLQIAAYGLFFYFTRGMIPMHLSALHPYPPIGNGLPSIFLLSFIGVGVSIALLYYFRNKIERYLPGLLWVGICLAPVLQLIPVGSAIVADRYFYLAAWGFLFSLGLLVENLVKNPKFGMAVLCILVISWMYGTMRRISVWKDGNTLFSNVLNEYPGNPTAANNLGNWLEKQNRYSEACAYYEMAVNSKPDFAQALFNLALCRQKSGNTEEAKQLNFLALAEMPKFPDAWNNLGTIYGSLGQLDSAKWALERAISLKPEYAAAWNNLGMYYLGSAQMDSARICFERSAGLDKNHESDARRNLQYLKEADGFR